MNPLHHLSTSRRHFCTQAGAGFGSLALLSLLDREASAAEAAGKTDAVLPASGISRAK